MNIFPSLYSFRAIGAFAAVAFFSGCETLDDSLQPTAPAHVPANFAGPTALPVHVSRVVLLPAAGDGVLPPESLAQLDPVFNSALQQEQRFELVTLNRSECRRRYGAEEFSSASALPAGLLARIAKDFGADAVMLVDITSFRAYRPLEIGLRAKLVVAKSRETVWNFDELFSLADQQVASGARQQARRTKTSLPSNPEVSMTQSPSAFALYAAKTAFSTLPQR